MLPLCSTEAISMKLRWRMGLGPEQTPLRFDAEHNFLTHLSLTLQERAFFFFLFFTFSLTSQGIVQLDEKNQVHIGGVNTI